MLSIGKLGGDARSERYYIDQVAHGREDYYAGHGEAPGDWLGAGAEELGLEGEVGAAQLAAVMQGMDPRSGEQLRRRLGPGSVAGFDLTFSAPKSVSVLWGAGSDEVARAAREAHDSAVRQALTYVERSACRTRRGAGGLVELQGEGLTCAAFRHRTSRAGDPQLHTHVVVANLTRAEGRHSTLDGRALYAHAKTAGYLYQAALRAELSDRLVIEWEPVQNGVADLAGIPRAALEHFSRRRAEIVAELARQGTSSPRAAAVAALATRRQKDYAVPADRLRAQWRARAQDIGLGPTLAVGPLARQVPGASAQQLEERAENLTGPEGLTAHAGSFDRRDVLRAWAEAHRAGASVRRIEALADHLLGSPEVVRLSGSGHEARYSTRDQLALERRLLEDAERRRGEGAGVVEEEAIERAIRARPTLSEEQQAMVRGLTRSGDGLQVVRGHAGTGKTFAIDAAREAWERSGHRVLGCSTAARAAAELQAETGIDCMTIAALERDLGRGYELARGSVLVVDEAGMVGSRRLERLARHAERARAKLVLVGDDRQLPEIDAGGGFRALAARLGALELTEVRRQRDRFDREALRALRDGRPEEWLRSNSERGRIVARRGAEATRAALVSDWWQGREAVGEREAVMIALRRRDVEELNERARAYMRARGELGERELEAGGRRFAAGDRVLTLDRERRLGLVNGLRGTVASVDRERRAVTVRLDDGREVEIAGGYLDAGKLCHGYALTAHKAQGMTVERTYVLGTADVYGEWAYTALSRHRESARFYVAAGDPRELRDRSDERGEQEVEVELVRALGRSRAKELALDEWEGDERLAARPTAELAEQAERLRPLLGSFPAAAREADRLAAEAARAEADAREAEALLARSRAELEQTSWRERRARAELERRIASQEEAAARSRERAVQRAGEHARASALAAEWVESCGGEVAQLVAVERELAERRAEERAALARALEVDPPDYVVEAIGPRPEGPAGRAEWMRAAERAEDYGERFGAVADLEAAATGDRLERSEPVDPQVVRFGNPAALEPDIDAFDVGP